MSYYSPPLENLSVFNSLVFPKETADGGITIAEGDSKYLRFPISQGSENMPSLSVSGATSANTASVSGTTQLTGTPTFTTTINLNKSSGMQTISCSAPSGIQLFETNSVVAGLIGLQTRSASIQWGGYLTANSNPRFYLDNLYEFVVSDRTTPAFTGKVRSNAFNLSILNESTTSSGGITFDCNGATTGGAINFTPANGTPSTTRGLILESTSVISGTAGGNSGQHLIITLNGVNYKIALLNP